MSGRGLRPLSVHRLRAGSPRGVLVQGPRVLPAVWRPAHGGALGASHRSGFPRRAGPTVVLSLPHRLRYLLAWDHELCRAVTGVAVQTVLGFLRVAPDVTACPTAG